MTATSGNSYHYADHVQSGQFSFQAVEAGDYMACFWALDQTPATTMTVDFDWRSGVAAKDWSNVAKKGSIDVSIFLLFVTFYVRCLYLWFRKSNG